MSTRASERVPAAAADAVEPGFLSRWWVAPSILLLAGWAALYPLTRHYGNPDGPSYVAVAELWLDGRVGEAVNAYWGPLLSWAAAPLIAIGVPGLDALRLVLLLGALAVLPSLHRLARLAGATPGATRALLCASAPFLVYTALFGLYPDVLMAAALLASAAALLRPSFTTSPAVAAAAGGLAAVGFLARAYALPVAVLALPLGAALHLLPPHRAPLRRVARHLGVALAVFALVVGTWVVALSAAYGAPTLTTSAGFNVRLVGPASAGNPFNVAGLHEPPRPDALSAWEEPSQLPIPRRQSVEDGESAPADGFGHRLGNAVANARIVVGSGLRRGAPLLALAALGLLAALRRRQLPPPAVTGTLLTGAIAAGGLLLSIAIERYAWLPLLLLVPAAAVGLDVALGGRRRRLGVVTLLLVAAMAATSVHGLVPRFGSHREVTHAARVLEGTGALDGDVATAGSWQETHLLCHHVGCRFFGRPRAEAAADLPAELAAAGIDHLVVWARDSAEITGVDAPPAGVLLRVYDVTAEELELRAEVPTR